MLDASSVVYAWENYPPEQFPPLWVYLGEEAASLRIKISAIALEETEHVLPECAVWVRDVGTTVVPIGNAIVHEANRIKQLLGVVGDDYHARGVDENDLLIVAAAGVHRHGLISNEAAQPSLPINMRQYKIPAVCNIAAVNVNCRPFLALITGSGRTF